MQRASVSGVRVNAWSTSCFQVDPGSGATRHKIESVANAEGIHRDARRRGWHLARVLAGLWTWIDTCTSESDCDVLEARSVFERWLFSERQRDMLRNSLSWTRYAGLRASLRLPRFVSAWWPGGSTGARSQITRARWIYMISSPFARVLFLQAPNIAAPRRSLSMLRFLKCCCVHKRYRAYWCTSSIKQPQVKYVVNPATAGLKCSFVELVAPEGVDAQTPQWCCRNETPVGETAVARSLLGATIRTQSSNYSGPDHGCIDTDFCK